MRDADIEHTVGRVLDQNLCREHSIQPLEQHTSVILILQVRLRETQPRVPQHIRSWFRANNKDNRNSLGLCGPGLVQNAVRDGLMAILTAVLSNRTLP